MDLTVIIRRVVGILNGPEPNEFTFPFSGDQDELDTILTSLACNITCGNGNYGLRIVLHKLTNGNRAGQRRTGVVDLFYDVTGNQVLIKVPSLPIGELAAVANDFPRHREGLSSQCRPPQSFFSAFERLRLSPLLRRYERYLASDQIVRIAESNESIKPQNVSSILGIRGEHATLDLKCKSLPSLDASFVRQYAFGLGDKGGGVIVKMLSSVSMNNGLSGSSAEFFSYGTDCATLFMGVHDDRRVLGHSMQFNEVKLSQTIFPPLLKEDVSLLKAYVDVDNHLLGVPEQQIKRWVIQESSEKKQGNIIELCHGKAWLGRSLRNDNYGIVVNSRDRPPGVTLKKETRVRSWVEVKPHQWPSDYFERRYLLKMIVKVSDSEIGVGCFMDDSSAFTLSQNSWFKHIGVWLRLKNNDTVRALFEPETRRTVFWGKWKPVHMDVDLFLNPGSSDTLTKFKAAIKAAHSQLVTVGVDFDDWKSFEDTILRAAEQNAASWMCSSLCVVIFFRLDSPTVETRNAGGKDESIKVMESLLRIEVDLKKANSFLVDVCLLTTQWKSGPSSSGVDGHTPFLALSSSRTALSVLKTYFAIVDDVTLSTDQLEAILKEYYLGNSESTPLSVFSGSYTVWTKPMTQLLQALKDTLRAKKLMFLKVPASQKGVGVTTVLKSVALQLRREMQGIKVIYLLNFPSADALNQLAEWFRTNQFVLIIDKKRTKSGEEQTFCEWLFSLRRNTDIGCVVGTSDFDRWIAPASRQPLWLDVTPFWSKNELEDYCQKLKLAFKDCPDRVFDEALKAVDSRDSSTHHYFIFAFAASEGAFKPVRQWLEEAHGALGEISRLDIPLVPVHHPRRVFEALAFVCAVSGKDCGLALRDTDSDILFAKPAVRAILKRVQHTVKLYASEYDRWVSNVKQERDSTFVAFVHPFFARSRLALLPYDLTWNGLHDFYSFVKDDLIVLLDKMDPDERDFVVENMLSDGTTLLQRLCGDWRQFRQMAKT